MQGEAGTAVAVRGPALRQGHQVPYALVQQELVVGGEPGQRQPRQPAGQHPREVGGLHAHGWKRAHDSKSPGARPVGAAPPTRLQAG